MNQKSIVIEDDTVSVEENDVESIDVYTEESPLSRAGRWIFYAFLLLFPVWFLPTALAPVDLNKAYFGGCALLISLLLILGGVLQEGRIRFVSSRLFLIYILFLIFFLISALFSANPNASLWGTGLENTTFASLLLVGVGFFITPLALQSREHIAKAFTILAISLSLLALFFFIQSVLRIDIFRWQFAQVRGFNPFGGWNALAIFFGFGIAIATPFMALRRSFASHIWIVISFVLLVASIFANLKQVWIALAVVMLFFVALAVSRRDQRSRFFAISLILLLLSVLSILLSDALTKYYSSVSISGFGRPQEIVLSTNTTIDLVKEILSSSPVLGSGPNSFANAWDKFKSPDINKTAFWQARFNAGSSLFLTLALEGGLASAALFLLIMLIFLLNGIRAIGSSDVEDRVLACSAFAGSLYMIIMTFLYPINFALIVLLFVTIGLFYASLRTHGAIQAKEINIFTSREVGFVFSLMIIFLLIISVGGIYYQTIRYIGVLSFGRGIAVYNTTSEINSAEQEIEKAISYDPSQDLYFRTYAELELLKIQRAVNNESLSQKDKQERFQLAYNKGLVYARTAIDLSKNEAENYRTLSRLYEVAIPVDPNVADIALENYESAQKLNPTNPIIPVDMARTQLAFADITLLRGGGSSSQKIAYDRREKAIEFLKMATELKPDNTQAYFTLSQLYAVQNKIDEAIKSAEQTSQLVPNNIGVLFQLGLLYYQKNDFDQARGAFERAISINPDYSNAKYFLGLIYDKEGRSQEALKLFQEIAALNPTNEEVQSIIKAIQAGKKASDALTKPPPEQRQNAPLKETEETPPREIPAL